MSRVKRMQPVVRIAQMREDDAMQELGKAQRQLQEQEERLKELCSYREEYSQNFHLEAGNGISAVRFQEFHRFMARLDQAIEQQQKVVENVNRLCSKKNQIWRQAHIKSKSLDKVVERYDEQEQYERAQREQRSMDEMAQQSMRSRQLLENEN